MNKNEFFSFVRHIFRNGFKRTLNENDIYDVVKVCESEKLGNRLENAWSVECKKEKPSFIWTLLKCFGVEYVYIGFHQFTYSLLLL